MSVQLDSPLHDALGVGFVPGISSLPPLLSRAELTRLKWQKVAKNSAKDNLGRAQTGDWARCVTVLEDGPDHFVCIK